ncbi:MAG: tRNA (adenosine(37)-N6)-threonylcarbamoyltransferase complex ATPase subunit type 1 TsaE [Candidatus Schekmanbacteria bacterium RIFCSPHIGHO2_02_FULL_38_11]|uniref:tRNA (Adenosine(37)-N6)-threonylcarbamoyltransferase complex ATPase subunit type 1 TsaE n=1 Tax=Candidatus Schekmanbacteria bacterium RIFCSPLOWO2_12_FULL_38_15 TaxID=1817883 RepID=A0A1F7SJT7_9BACT|nr:MAG: tRNA (adenosine(37)-N6)-threonylcarbamoyltransferase complex ATPase subunit type 1 TsaE [Candidatus Schekmanbacteria bacterium GWA2_38_9]OGL51707.1 MAG: tRNA (adenosine(37)-N6)-threonylcarbamoyltransferase complex ATPase subunit type 1 TsaE [Candidatus Schekmanbacteria bacterium RIFCSPLOWO2_02_FULL_38_14]OGL52376.1 MAG: tRNA (adenosine(37)-N6)-threonylcarbamoyltransferase complex ATPase subunit type 1 TsaE [Candidatus Schekmanbacteria bacterium RIFCSPHIGHO2_02_FULL_38_11]OGL54030.1 MAG: 
MNSIILTSNSVNDTMSLGRDIGAMLVPGDLVALVGELGAGKTYLTKGIASGLGIVESQKIVSPSFTIINEYTCPSMEEKFTRKISIYHIDFYKVNRAEEMEVIGIFEYFDDKNAIKVIEWADKFPEFLPEEYFQVTIKALDESRREIKINAKGKDCEKRLKDMKSSKTNVTHMMEKRLPGKISDYFNQIGRIADELGVNAYVVGGFVRDLILDEDNFDLDIVVEGDGISLAREFSRRLDGKCKVHRRFGTSVVLFSDGDRIDFATARSEYYKSPAALPVVTHSLIRDDLFRRDFTINALAIKLGGNGSNVLVDYFGGQRDIREKKIRILHKLSFVDDPTRVFRAIRFEQRLTFCICKETEKLIREAVGKEMFHRLSGKRLFAELILILKEKHCYRSIWRMREFGLLQFFQQQLDFTKTREGLIKRIDEVINWYRSSGIKRECHEWLVYLMGLVIMLEERDLKEFSDRLAVPHKFRSRIKDVKERYENILKKFKDKRKLKPSEIAGILQGLDIEGLLFLMASAKNKKSKQYISDYLTRLMEVRREINGDDLKKLGIKPGPEYKKILNDVYNARLDGLIKCRNEEIELAKKLAERYKS